MILKKFHSRNFKNMHLVVILFFSATLVFMALVLPQNKKPSSASILKSNQLSPVARNEYFANKVLHWSQIKIDFTRNGADPANGKEVVADIWIQTDSQGQPIYYHSRYSLQDGTFLQEVWMTKTTMFIVSGKLYKNLVPTPLPSQWCIYQRNVTLQELESRLPPFVDELSLKNNGFQPDTESYVKAVPTTSSMPKMTHVNLYGLDLPLHTWVQERRLSSSEGTVIQKEIMEVTSDGRLIWSSSDTSNLSGTALQANWVSFGTLFVYDAKVVPGSFLLMPDQGKKGECNE